MSMTTVDQAKGKVKANFVRVLPTDPRYARMNAQERANNDRLPLFRGTISAPEAPEDIHEYAVWSYTGKDGKEFLAGSVKPLSTRAGVEDHLFASPITAEDAKNYDPETGEVHGNPYELTANTIIIRVNAAKVLKSDPAFTGLDESAAELNAKRPLYWLKWQRAAGQPEVRGSLWDRSGRYGPFLDGNTQYPIEKAPVAASAGEKRKPRRETVEHAR